MRSVSIFSLYYSVSIKKQPLVPLLRNFAVQFSYSKLEQYRAWKLKLKLSWTQLVKSFLFHTGVCCTICRCSTWEGHLGFTNTRGRLILPTHIKTAAVSMTAALGISKQSPSPILVQSCLIPMQWHLAFPTRHGNWKLFKSSPRCHQIECCGACYLVAQIVDANLAVCQPRLSSSWHKIIWRKKSCWTGNLFLSNGSFSKHFRIFGSVL